MPYNIKRTLMLPAVLLMLSLTSCGFHLRGRVELSNNLSPLYLQQNSAYALARDLRALLSGNDIDVVGKADQANASLILLSESRTQHVLSIDTRGRAREYLLTYRVQVQFKGVRIKPTRDTISINRTLLFDPNAILAVTDERATIYRDMRRDAASRILVRLEALDTAAKAKAKRNE